MAYGFYPNSSEYFKVLENNLMSSFKQSQFDDKKELSYQRLSTSWQL